MIFHDMCTPLNHSDDAFSCLAWRRSRSRSLASVGKCTARSGTAAGCVTESNWCTTESGVC
eukprot:6563815-Lingulodinium_polyedra.AAC.1